MIKQIFIITLGTLKGFWTATIKTTWGIVGIYLLAGMIKSMNIDATRIIALLDMSILLIKYWIIFWLVFFVKYLYNEIRFGVIE